MRVRDPVGLPEIKRQPLPTHRAAAFVTHSRTCRQTVTFPMEFSALPPSG